MNDSVMPFLSQVKKQVWKWIGQYIQLMVNCLINAEVKMFKRGIQWNYNWAIYGQIGQ